MPAERHALPGLWNVSMATQARWRARIDRVISALGDRIDAEQPVDMAALAEIACLSPHHFHRVYRAMTGETPAETVRRMRLHRAAVELVRSTATIAAIGGRAGYRSVEAFTRAFADAYGAPPARFRGANQSPPPLIYNDTEKTHMTKSQEPKIEIRNYPALRLVALPHRGPYDQIGSAFERFANWAGGAGLFGPESVMAAVYYDDPTATAPQDLRSAAGVILPAGAPVPPSSELPIEETTLAAGPYAVLIHEGPYATLHVSYDHLYGVWLPASGRTPADQPSIEVYLNDPSAVAPADLRTEIRMALVDEPAAS